MPSPLSPILQLPGPSLGDGPPDIPADIQALIDRLEELAGGFIPIGASVEYAGSGDPGGAYAGLFLLEDGRSLDATADATLMDLFNAIGTSYGGTGASNFRLPDSRDRVTVGPGNMGTARGDANLISSVPTALGNTGGVDTVTLAISQIPNHNHGGATGTAQTSDDGLHSHVPGATGYFVTYGAPSGGSTGFTQASGVSETKAADQTNSAGQHHHDIPALSIAGQGGGGSHDNKQPFLVKNKIIRVR